MKLDEHAPGSPPWHRHCLQSMSCQSEQQEEEQELIQSTQHYWLHAVEAPRVVDGTLGEDVEWVVLPAVAATTMDLLVALASAVAVVVAVLVLVLVLVPVQVQVVSVAMGVGVEKGGQEQAAVMVETTKTRWWLHYRSRSLQSLDLLVAPSRFAK